MAEVLIVAAFSVWLSPLNTRTAFAAASEYAQTTGYGPYDRIIFSHVHRRPFEVCAGVDVAHAQVLTRIQQALPGIESSSKYEAVRLMRLGRTFNRETQTFFTSSCPTEWTYFHSYVDYQSWLMKVAPVIWLVDALHRSEIYVVVLLIVGSWFGIFCLFETTKRLSGSSVVAFASLAVLWFSQRMLGPTLQYADVYLNLFNSFALIGLAVFLCEPRAYGEGWVRPIVIELAAALVFALYTLLLMFLRLPSTRLDGMAVIACVVAVAAVRWNPRILRRAVLLFACVALLSAPYQRYSRSLLAPVSPVNTAAADEFKLVNAVQFLTERPSHFGNFLQDLNFSWIHSGDYYLCQLSWMYAFHHGYPAWGRRFLGETLRGHPFELPNAWWKRFAIQVVYHRELSYGLYDAHRTLGVVTLWFGVLLMAVVLFGGRRTASSWPLAGLVFWEIFGLQTFLGLMHVHNIYLLKGVPMLWCALPPLIVIAAREVAAWIRHPWRERFVRWRSACRTFPKLTAACGVVCALTVAWLVREYLKEVHVTRVWRAVHVGQYYADAFLTPDELVGEVDAIHRLGGDAPGAVSMYGAWALRAYVDRIGGYEAVAKRTIDAAHVKQLTLQLFRRGLAEGPDNPHFYAYALDLGDPQWPGVFEEGLRRFPEHPYAVMMSWYLCVAPGPVPEPDLARRRALYEGAVRRQLREYESLRPGFRPHPVLVLDGLSVNTDMPDGTLTTLLPDEIAYLESFPTYNTDRLSLGLFLKVIYGSLTGELVDAAGARLADLPPMTPRDPIAYRTWHLQGLPYPIPGAKDGTARIRLTGGPQGARFVVRDLYPLVENPRWFR